MSRRRPHLSFGKVVSHLGVIVAVSVVLGVLTAALVVPVRRRRRLRHQRDRPVDAEPPRRAEGRAAGPAHPRPGPRRQPDRDLLRREPRQRPPRQGRRRSCSEAIIAIEDYRFYEHGALDIKGTLRAFVSNQTSGGGTQGGSSITQQMAKMTLLTQARTAAERKAATENTYQRKIQELRHAIAFEQNYSKDWILERYLNLAYFGDGAYGIQAASRHYFAVNASQLNLRAGRHPGRAGEEPGRLRPHPLSRTGRWPGATSCSTGWRSSTSSSRRRSSKLDPAARSGCKVQQQPQRLPGHQGRLLLRLRTPLPDGRPGPSARPPPTAPS